MIDLAALAPRLLRPDRPQLSSARRKAREVLLEAWTTDAPWLDPEQTPEHWLISDPELEATLAQQVWEAVAPVDWVGDAHRRYGDLIATSEDGHAWTPCLPGDEDLSRARYRQRGSLYPARLREAIVLAGDPVGMTTAEALAREFAARMAPWRWPRPSTVVWRVVDGYGVVPRSEAPDVSRFPDLEASLAGADPVSIRLGANVLSNAYAHADVFAAVRWRARRSAGMALPGALEGLRYDDLADPFEPLLSLWASGYALESVYEEALVLVAPDL